MNERQCLATLYQAVKQLKLTADEHEQLQKCVVKINDAITELEALRVSPKSEEAPTWPKVKKTV